MPSRKEEKPEGLNICAGIGRGQMSVADAHIAHHKHVQSLYEELLAGVPGVKVHLQPFEVRTDASDSRVYEESFSGVAREWEILLDLQL